MAAPVISQTNFGAFTGTSNPSLSFTSNTVDGCVIAACVSWNSTAQTADNVSDGGDGVGGVFQTAVPKKTAPGAFSVAGQMFYAENCTGRVTPTVTYSLSTAMNGRITITELQSVATASAFLLGTSTNGSASGTRNLGTITVNTSNSALLGFVSRVPGSPSTFTSNASWPTLALGTAHALVGKVVSATASYTPEIVMQTTGGYVGLSAAFAGVPDAAAAFFGFRTMTGVGI